MSGVTISPSIIPVRNNADHIRAVAANGLSGVLLIPESTNDRVMAFDPMTGDLLDADFIPSDPTNLSTPIDAILATDNQSILVSDQLEDVVQQYDLDGNYLGIFAPIGGVNADAIAQFDASGNVLVANFNETEEGVVEYTSTGTLVDIYDPVTLRGCRGVYELPNGNILATNGSGVHEIDR